MYFETAAVIITLILARPLPRSARSRSKRARAARPARARREDRAARERRRDPDREPGGRRPVRRPAGREDRHRRRRRRRCERGRRLDAHRRTGAGRGRHRRRGVRRDAEHLGPARRRSDARRRRHRARADRAPRRSARKVAKAPVQHLADRISAVFVPIVLVIAAGDARRLAASPGSRRRRRVHRCGRGADHRLPVRARPRDADRDHGRHRPRRAARHRDQGRRRARGDATHRQRRARQDGHDHRRPHGARRRRRRADGVDVDEALRLVGSAEDASEHPIARAIARGAARAGADRCRADAVRRTTPASGVRATVDGHAVVVGRRERCSTTLPHALHDRGRRRRRAGRTAVVAAAGTARPRAVFVVADTVKPLARAAIDAFHELGLEVVMATGDAPRTADAVADEVGIDDVVAGVLPDGQGRRRAASCKPTGRGSRSSATA